MSVRGLYARRWGGGWLGPGVVGSAAVEDEGFCCYRIDTISIPTVQHFTKRGTILDDHDEHPSLLPSQRPSAQQPQQVEPT